MTCKHQVQSLEVALKGGAACAGEVGVQADPWGSLTSQTRLISELLATERPCLIKQNIWLLGRIPKVDPWHPCAHICSCTNACSHMNTGQRAPDYQLARMKSKYKHKEP